MSSRADSAPARQGLSPEEHILSAALSVIRRSKISGTRMRDIAEQVGISPGTLHYYFPTKADLLLALLDRMQQTFDNDRVRLFAEARLEPASRLGVFARNQLRILTQQPELEEVFFDFWGQGMIDAEIRPRIQRMYGEWRKDIRAVIDEGVAQGVFLPERAEMAVVILIALLEGAALQILLEPGLFELDAYMEAASAIALDFLGAPARPPYPGDLSDAEWEQIAGLLPDARPGGRPREANMREVVNAVLYVAHCGCPWRMLPHDFPAWQTVYGYYRRWAESGVLGQIEAVLKRKLRPAAGEDE